MQNDEYSSTGTLCVPAADQEDSSSRVQLSPNMINRLEKLAEWRLDPSLFKFPDGCPEFGGGYATVSRALLASRTVDAGDRVVESNVRSLTPIDRISESAGDDECRETEVSREAASAGDEAAAERQEQVLDGKPSKEWKAVAVKKMRVKISDDAVRVLGLTLREAEFVAGLSHENVIKLEGFVEDLSKNMFWLVFPYEDNGTLKDFIASVEWEIPERIWLICDVIMGVEYLHSREPYICHGDLKSTNILVNSECRAVITDFGSAYHPGTKDFNKEKEQAIEKLQRAPSLQAKLCPSTNTITLTCNQYTLRWAAPELLGEDSAGLPCDIWAFGCVVYEVMTNSIPFQDVTDAIVVMRVTKGDLPSISSVDRMVLIQALCTLVEQCWNVDPSKRPTAHECRRAINWMPMIVPNPERSPELLMKMGDMHRRQNDYFNASKYFTKALGIYIEILDDNGSAKALSELAQVHRLQNQYEQAVAFYTQALQVWTKIGDIWGRAGALFGLAEVHRLQNEYSEAVRLYSEALEIRIDIGDRQGTANALFGLAELHRHRDETGRAVAFSEDLRIRDNIDTLGRADAA